jgi:hypothetical protein
MKHFFSRRELRGRTVLLKIRFVHLAPPIEWPSTLVALTLRVVDEDDLQSLFLRSISRNCSSALRSEWH